MNPAEEAARERWFDVTGPVCRMCGIDEGLQLHHVCAKSWLKRHNLRHLLWDIRNRMVICSTCHEAHENASRRIPFSALSEDNVAFIDELRGRVPIEGHLRRYPGYEERSAA